MACPPQRRCEKPHSSRVRWARVKQWPARTAPLGGLAAGQSCLEPLEGGRVPQKDRGDRWLHPVEPLGEGLRGQRLTSLLTVQSPLFSPPHTLAWWAEPWGGSPRATWLLSLTSSGALGKPFKPAVPVSTPVKWQ